MTLTLVTILYVLVAISMIGMILMQRGPGAAAGSGFGAGASGTVFGARSASNFLSKTTAVLATLFFVISLGMAWYATHRLATPQDDLGVMGRVAAPADTQAVPPPSLMPAIEPVISETTQPPPAAPLKAPTVETVAPSSVPPDTDADGVDEGDPTPR